jgi:hypothetical protein
MRIMKKVVLGLMLIVGSLSFANDRVDRGEKSSDKWQNAKFLQQEESSKEYISRGVQISVEEDLPEFILIKERGSNN